jgi:hypothetical protein
MAKSDWLPQGTPPCKDCKGTGSAGKNAKGETIACPSCNGFGH